MNERKLTYLVITISAHHTINNSIVDPFELTYSRLSSDSMRTKTYLYRLVFHNLLLNLEFS